RASGVARKACGAHPATANQFGAVPWRARAAFQLESARGRLRRAASGGGGGRQRSTRGGQPAGARRALRGVGRSDGSAFDIDVLACPGCGGRLKLIAIVEDPGAIRAILRVHAGSEKLVGRAPPFVSVLDASDAAAIGA